MAHRWFTKLFGTRFDRELKRVQPIIDAIHTHEARLKELSEDALNLAIEAHCYGRVWTQERDGRWVAHAVGQSPVPAAGPTTPPQHTTG